MKVFITKYAMSAGITEHDAEKISDTMISVSGEYGSSFYHGHDWHTTIKEAVAHAEIMRVAKLTSLEKSAAKIRAMDFTKLKEGK